MGKIALITGASSGIGAATARRLAREGLRVVLVARREDRLKVLEEEICQAGGEALAIAADLADEAQRERLFRQVYAGWGPLDLLVNNAGMGWYGYCVDMPWPVAQQMMQVNMAAMVHLTLLFLPSMRARGSGHIINVSSIAGSLPNQGIAMYGATKSFVDNFTTSLYREMRGSGVKVSVVRPGPVATEFFDASSDARTGLRMPAERFGVRPERVAERIWALVKRPRRVAYVPGFFYWVPWVEPTVGWLIDLLGPLLLKKGTDGKKA